VGKPGAWREMPAGEAPRKDETRSPAHLRSRCLGSSSRPRRATITTDHSTGGCQAPSSSRAPGCHPLVEVLVYAAHELIPRLEAQEAILSS
jgi:hypothetical protein